MPLVFVHGVSTRSGPDYDRAVAQRDLWFRQVTFAGDAGSPYVGEIGNPYWGGSGARFAWNHASLPGGNVQAMGVDASDLSSKLPIAGVSDKDTVLSRVAAESLSDAVDLLLVLAADQSPAPLSADLLGVAGRASAYAAANEQPNWVRDTDTNEQFVEKLLTEVERWNPGPSDQGAVGAGGYQAMGLPNILNPLLAGIDQLKSAAANWVSRRVVDATRDTLHPVLATFIGDVLVYVNERGSLDSPGPIIETIMQDLAHAFAARRPEDPLVLVGHSLGGVVLYDLCSHYLADGGLIPGFKADTLVTVGSQVGLFEEMKQFKGSTGAYSATAGNRVPRPDTVERWINVFDDVDVLSFAAAGVFDGVDDYRFSSKTGLLSAHSSYFLRPSFYERLRARLKEGPRP